MDYRTYSQYTDSYLGQNYDYSQYYASYGYNPADPRLSVQNVTYSNSSYDANEYENNYFSELQKNYDLTLSRQDAPISAKSDDELWVETFLADIGKIKLNLESTVLIQKPEELKKPLFPQKSINILGAKAALKNSLKLLEKLKSQQAFLDENVASLSSSEWRKKTVEIGALKEEFSKILSQFDNPDLLRQLKRTLHKRKKKRINSKIKKSDDKARIIELNEIRKSEEKKGDEWLESMKEEVERIKMEENMKKDADCVLSEVTKKKSDARKQLSLLSALIKLRNVRETVAIQRGEKTSTEDRSIFANIADKLTIMWQNALKSYNKEEQGLRMMLEQNAVEDTLAARLQKQKKVTQEWELVFFGPKTIPSPAYWGLTSAERDVETFIAIRKSWDTFLCRGEDENSSKIPIGWILPGTDATESWTKYLQK